MSCDAGVSDVSALFAGIPGQERAVERLIAAVGRPTHAYLLVGPPGVGKRQAAGALAAALLGGADDQDLARRAAGFAHPDVRLYERTGAALSVDDAREITKLAYRSPLEASSQVVVVPDVHLVREAGPALLKTIEEPPPAVYFILLADLLVPELVTIASRCSVIELQALDPGVLAAVLVAEGAEPAAATAAAGASGGRLDRARLLVGDPGFASRQAAWRSVPDRLDGTGATVAVLVDELLGQVDSILEPLKANHARELEELAELDAITGRASGRADIDARHKRELRRLRTDELQAGLATLAGTYRDRLVEGRADPSAFDALRDATAELVRNPNEPLLLSALLLRLDP